MNEFFMDPALEWAKDLEAVVNLGLHLAELYNTSAMDSLHLAAAILLHADDFITTEQITRADVQSRTSGAGNLLN